MSLEPTKKTPKLDCRDTVTVKPQKVTSHNLGLKKERCATVSRMQHDMFRSFLVSQETVAEIGGPFFFKLSGMHNAHVHPVLEDGSHVISPQWNPHLDDTVSLCTPIALILSM